MIHKYLFYINDEKVKIYCLRNGNFELIRRDGEESSKFADKLFWKWWEETSSFNRVKDESDFCFINSSDCEYLYLDYKITPDTTWCFDEIKKFYEEHMEYSRIVFCYDTSYSNKSFSFAKEAKWFADNAEKVFQLTVCSEGFLRDNNMSYVSDGNSESEIRKYYQRKIAKSNSL